MAKSYKIWHTLTLFLQFDKTQSVISKRYELSHFLASLNIVVYLTESELSYYYTFSTRTNFAHKGKFGGPILNT